MDTHDDLFGSDEEEPQQQPEPAPAAPKADMKSRLAALAAAKRKASEEEAQQQAAKKAKKQPKPAALVDFGDDDEEEEEEEVGDGRRPEDEDEQEYAGKIGTTARRRAQQERATERAERAEEAPPPELDEEEEGALAVTDADRAFIDDTGVEEEARVDFGEEDEVGGYDEAEEAGEEDELEAMFSKKKQRGGLSEAEAKAMVENVLATMEAAAEEDLKQYEQGAPAVFKLRVLSKVEEVLSTKRLHSELLDAGLLGVLKAWIEPMPDGTLPNARIREFVLRLLHQLPVDCSLEDRKEQLKRSGLGRVVMFLFKLPDETPSNRRLAKELVERWSRPILAPNRAQELDAEEQERILAARQQRQARLAAQKAGRNEQQDEDQEGQRRRQPKPGEAGFRYHAAIPQPASLDYIKAPASRYALPEKKAGGKGKEEHKLAKKLKGMAKGGRAGRAAVVSVEGRNVTIQH